MKTKSLKSKILAGTITVGILSSAGFAMANMDAGAQLKGWYDGLVKQTNKEITEDVTKYAEGKMPALKTEYASIKTGATNDINSKRDSEISSSKSDINKAKEDRINSINKKKQEIKDNIGLEFYNLFLEGYNQIQTEGNNALNAAKTDLTTHTNQVGSDAVAEVTTQLNTATQQAVSDLQEAINKAKNELIAEVETQQEINTRNLKNQVDWKIDDVRKEIKKVVGTLVGAQQTIIANKAQELETNAIADLDAVVAGINN